MRAAILGATKGIGRAVARRLAERGDALVLLGRDPDDLERSARDLEVRGDRDETRAVSTVRCDLEDRATIAPALDAAVRELGGLDLVLVTAGAFGTQEDLENDVSQAERVLDTNFTATVLFLEEARKRLLAAGGGTLCAVSSVAGERGRKPVILYGASKAGLTRYLEGLDHKFRRLGLKVVTVKPGFVRTGMTAGLPAPPFAGDPEGVARDIVRAIDRGRPVVYTPWPWRYLMWIVRRLPRAVMRRLSF